MANKNTLSKAAATSPKVSHIDYMSREEALALLGVKLQSFYTYVSRGLIRRHEVPGQKRKLYLKSDVERLSAKSLARTNTGAKAGDAMRYGNPIVQTWICQITPQGPLYRNRLATDLASANVSFESVAELLWVGRLRSPESPWRLEALPEEFSKWTKIARQIGDTPEPLQIISLLLTGLRATGRQENGTEHGNTIPLASQLLQVFAGVSGYLGPRKRFENFRDGEQLAECIARGLQADGDMQKIEAINAALVICAEHELTPPTFAARVCASTGADLYACVATGILAHMGPLQGGGTDGAENLLDEILKPAGRLKLPRARSMRFDFPGFNHPLYARDPRAVFLLDLVRKLKSPHPDAARMLQLIDSIEADMNFYPSITAALVILSRSLGLPRRSASILFSVGRTAGWISHVLEQRIAGFMLRPRAQFALHGDSAGATGMK